MQYTLLNPVFFGCNYWHTIVYLAGSYGSDISSVR